MKKSSIQLLLGDRIEIKIKGNSFAKKYYIHYLDETVIKLYLIINDIIIRKKIYNIIIENNILQGILEENDDAQNIIRIESIRIISRNKTHSYAKQNNFLPKKWIHIFFKDLDNNTFDIIGHILNLKNDLIEVKIYDIEKKTKVQQYLYIDFKYNGLPKYLDAQNQYPLTKIQIIPSPIQKSTAASELQKNKKYIADPDDDADAEDDADDDADADDDDDDDVEDDDDAMEDDDDAMEDEDSDEEVDDGAIEDSDEEAAEDAEDTQRLMQTITSPQEDEFAGIEETNNIPLPEHPLSEIIFDIDEELNKIDFQYANIERETEQYKRRFTLEQQISDFMEKMYGKIPSNKRTPQKKKEIENRIHQFEYLRADYSIFDDKNGYITGICEKPINYNPIQKHIQKENPPWILHIIDEEMKRYDNFHSFEKSKKEVEFIQSIFELQRIYKENNSKVSGLSSYVYYYNELGKLYSLVQTIPDTNICTTAEKDHEIIYIRNENKSVKRMNNSIDYSTFEILKNGKRRIERKSLMAPDKYNSHSSIILPDECIHITPNLPSASIMHKTHISQTPLFFFKMKNAIPDEYITPLFTNAKEKDKYMSNRFESFQEILNNIYDASFDNYSMLSIVKKCEPYLITMKDISIYNKKKWDKTAEKWNTLEKNSYILLLTFLQKHIKTHSEIIKYKREILLEKQKKHIYHKLPNPFWNEMTQPQDNDIHSFYKKIFNNIETEGAPEGAPAIEYTMSEWLVLFTQYDMAIFLSFFLSNDVFLLNSTEFILNKIEKPLIKDDDAVGVMYNDCNIRFLTKKYTSLSQLQNDNNEPDIYFDSQYDETPYSLINLYINEKQKMDDSLFLQFLQKKLKNTHGFVNDDMAREIAWAILYKKRRVKEGHYAILQEQKKQRFYVRDSKHRWIPDTSITPASFMDDNFMFCNVDKKCMKNTQTKMCENLDNKLNTLEMQNEFQYRVGKTIDEYKKFIQSELQYIIDHQHMNDIIRVNTLFRNDIVQRHLSENVKNINILSPYSSLKNKILGVEDEIEKSKYILLYIDIYCREPIHTIENPHWYYCKETDTPLFPKSLVEKAHIYNEEHDINIIKKRMKDVIFIYAEKTNQGYIDKYSGYKIDDMEYVEETEYNDEGFIIQRATVIENDVFDDLMKLNKTQQNANATFAYDPTEYENYIHRREFQDVRDVLQPILKTIGLKENLFIIPVVIHTFQTIQNSYFLMSAQDFENFRLEKIKVDKNFEKITYDTFKLKFILYYVLSFLFIEIQLSYVQNQMKKSKNIPGCILSFDGFPLDTDSNNRKGIEYLTCVVFNLIQQYQATSKIWKILKTATQQSIEKTLFDTIEKVMVITEIQTLYDIKREFILNKKMNMIPPKYNITNKWQGFLPPIVPFHIVVEPLPFNIKIISHVEQKKLNMKDILQHKITEYTLFIIENIQNIVKGDEQQIKTKNTFLDNSCCQDDGIYNIFGTMNYFIQKKEIISQSIEIIKHITLLRESYSNINKGTTLFMKQLYKPQHIDNVYIQSHTYEDYNPHIFYMTVFHYGNFDNERPIMTALQPLIGLHKPANYNTYYDIEQKIEVVKNAGKTYNLDFFKHVMKIIQHKNLLKIYSHVNIQDINTFNNFKQYIVEKKMYAHIQQLFLSSSQYCKTGAAAAATKKPAKGTGKSTNQSYDFVKYITEIVENTNLNTVFPLYSDKKIMEFNQFLRDTIQCFHTHITDYITLYNKKSLSSFQSFFTDYFTKYQNINNTKSPEEITNYCHSLLSSMHFIIHEISNMFLYSSFSQFDIVPQSWKTKLLPVDIRKILDKIHETYDIFQSLPFYDCQENEDVYYKNYIQQIQNELSGLYDFLRRFPVFSHIQNGPDEFFFFMDMNTTLLVFQYVWLLVIDTCIGIVENRAVLIINEIENDDFLNEIEFEYSDTHSIYPIFFKKDVALFLSTCIQHTYNNFDSSFLSVPYNMINEKVDIMRQREKRNLASLFLGRMTTEELRIENEKKKFKLDNWSDNIHFFRYDKKYEETARKLLDQYIEIDVENNDYIGAADIAPDDEDIYNDGYDTQFESGYDDDNNNMYSDDNDNGYSDYNVEDYE